MIKKIAFKLSEEEQRTLNAAIDILKEVCSQMTQPDNDGWSEIPDCYSCPLNDGGDCVKRKLINGYDTFIKWE